MHAGICLVLERNDSSGFNPDTAKERLEVEGMTVKRFDVRGSAQTVLFRAGSFFGDEKQAERVIRERSGRLAAFEKTKANIREGQLAVMRSAIRSSIRHEHYVFIVSKRCSLSKLLNNSSGLMNNTSMSGSEKMPGGNDQRIAAALCHCSLFEIRAANCSSHVLTCCCDEAPIA